MYRLTLERAREMALPIVELPGWYDVDDEASLRLLEEEFNGRRPEFVAGAEAPATRKFLASRRVC